jgi:hypothetical protein
MRKKLPGIIFIISLSFNAAFLIYLFTPTIFSKPKITGNEMKLELTDQQKKHLEPSRVKIHRENETIKSQITLCQQKLMAALKADPVDRAAINKCIENINNLQKKIQQNTIEEILLLREHMDTDQCNCLMEGLNAAMESSTRACDCPQCRAARKSEK